MERITTAKSVDSERLSVKIASWLNEHKWDTTVRKAGTNIWQIVGVKRGFVRSCLCSKGKVDISIFDKGATTEIQIHDHSFGENWKENTVWALSTGGTNLLISAAGKLGISRLTDYIRSLV